MAGSTGNARARLLHGSPWQGVFHLTGGGAGFLAELLGTAGASRTVLDASVPYSAASLADLLGGPPDQACSGDTARALAMTGFERAMGLNASRPFGFACTASLATDRVKRGRCRAHMAVQTAARGAHAEFRAFSEPDDRAAQERELVEAAWSLLLAALGLAAGHGIKVDEVEAGPQWRALVEGRLTHVSTAPHDGSLLFPGAFNPLHEGHRGMLAVAERRLERQGAYELSIRNPDKPLLDYFEIRTRLEGFDRPVWLTRLPTFAEKARKFPGATFVVGADTLVRIADPRYYGGFRRRDEQLGELLGAGARFLVFGRLLDGRFQGLGDQDLPAILMDACTGVDESEFRLDLSSSRIRRPPGPAAPCVPPSSSGRA